VEWTESALPITVALKPALVAEQIVVTAERAVTFNAKKGRDDQPFSAKDVYEARSSA
jgi:hypothetical protein